MNLGATRLPLTGPSALILEVARAAGVEVPDNGREKRAIRCPRHDDHTPSAFVSERGVFYCARCTPDRGLNTREFAMFVGVSLDGWRLDGGRASAASNAARPTPTISAQVWREALARALDDERVDEDSAVYDYLRERGLCESWLHRAFGVLAPGMELPPEIAAWPARGFRLVVPLFSRKGEVVNVQVRRSSPGTPKILGLPGHPTRGTFFANGPARSLLQDGSQYAGPVFVGEGATDHLALTAATAAAVICSPGAAVTESVFGAWATNRELVLVGDNDPVGDAAVQRVTEAAAAFRPQRLRRVHWPAGCKDAAEVAERHGIDVLGHILAGVASERGDNQC